MIDSLNIVTTVVQDKKTIADMQIFITFWPVTTPMLYTQLELQKSSAYLYR